MIDSSCSIASSGTSLVDTSHGIDTAEQAINGHIANTRIIRNQKFKLVIILIPA